ncbi:hypothetical protein K438DRAFT_1782731 [Mycena galopus ATCC 62051]|nr:hypothetical protein K438DRAFT_1782731 [Mycena galopus ATCC 62051]
MFHWLIAWSSRPNGNSPPKKRFVRTGNSRDSAFKRKPPNGLNYGQLAVSRSHSTKYTITKRRADEDGTRSPPTLSDVKLNQLPPMWPHPEGRITDHGNYERNPPVLHEPRRGNETWTACLNKLLTSKVTHPHFGHTYTEPDTNVAGMTLRSTRHMTRTCLQIKEFALGGNNGFKAGICSAAGTRDTTEVLSLRVEYDAPRDPSRWMGGTGVHFIVGQTPGLVPVRKALKRIRANRIQLRPISRGRACSVTENDGDRLNCDEGSPYGHNGRLEIVAMASEIRFPLGIEFNRVRLIHMFVRVFGRLDAPAESSIWQTLETLRQPLEATWWLIGHAVTSGCG